MSTLWLAVTIAIITTMITMGMSRGLRRYLTY